MTAVAVRPTVRSGPLASRPAASAVRDGDVWVVDDDADGRRAFEAKAGAWSAFGAGANVGEDDPNVWSALDHGVGATVDLTTETLAIKTFLQAAHDAGAVAYFPKRDYVSSWFYLDNVIPRITAAPGARILMGNSNDYWNFGPSTGVVSSMALTANAAVGTRTITVASTAGIAADDLVQIGDTATMVGGNSATLNVPALNTYRVLSVDSGTVITISEPLIYAMTTANGASLKILNVKRRGWVKGLHFESTVGQGAGKTAGFLRFYYCRDLDVDVTANGFSSAGMILMDCYAFRVRARVTNFADVAVTGVTGQFGYGVDIGGASAHGEVEAIADRCRHAVVFAGTGHNVKVTGVATDCTSGAWDAHPGFTNAEFADCITRGGGTAAGVGGYAYLIRGDRYSVIGGSCDQTNGGVYCFDAPKNVVVRGLTVTRTRNGGHGVQVGDPIAGLTVQGCNFDDLAGNGIFLNFTWTFSDLRIQGNAFRNVTGAVFKGQTSSIITRARFVDNIVEDNQGSPTTTSVVNLPTTTGTVTDFLVEGNHVANSIPLTAGAGAVFLSLGNPAFITGSGSPEGVVTAPVTSLFFRTDGGATTTLYVKTSGAGNTGWTAK